MKFIKHTEEQVLKDFNKIHNYKFDYSLVNYINSYTIIKIICPIHGVFEQTPNNHKRGKGCKKCSYEKITQSKNIFINKSNSIHNSEFDYSLVDYINALTKVKIICKKCNNVFKQTPNKHLMGQGCPNCKKSKGENKIKLFLENNNIKFEEQKIFEGCKYKRNLKFDFYLPNINTCIEFDGDQHFEKYRFEKNDDRLKIRVLRDSIKTEFCKINNIKLIRIKSNDVKNIDNILKLNI
jgi:very-short-patch-repair endonuclease